MVDYINRDALLQEIEQERRASKSSFPRQHFVVGDVLNCIRTAPAADVVEVTFCKDCRYYQDAKVNEKGFLICPASGMEITETDFCSYGQRKIETVLPKSDAKDESLEVAK